MKYKAAQGKIYIYFFMQVIGPKEGGRAHGKII
jgi:hypothetical protein